MFIKSKSNTIAVKHYFNPDGESGALKLVTDTAANIYGFYIENENNSPVYIQIFDESDVDNITLGTTVPQFTFRINASSAFGRDSQEIPLINVSKGFIFAITTGRQNDTLPASSSYVHVWYWDIP